MFRRMPTSPPATGMMAATASGNHLVQQHQQIQQQQYNNEMLHDPSIHQQQQQQQSGGKPAGTITGMLADFSRALGNFETSLKRKWPTINFFYRLLVVIFFLSSASVVCFEIFNDVFNCQDDRNGVVIDQVWEAMPPDLLTRHLAS